jgi:RNA polymerase sigma-70 factor, ECF subfamily
VPTAGRAARRAILYLGRESGVWRRLRERGTRGIHPMPHDDRGKRLEMSLQSAAAKADDDLDLARRIGAGDERALEAVMRAHNRMLYRLARSILKDDAEAEDAVQEAYLAGYRNIASFRGGAKLSTWFARIVINEAYGRLRKRKRMAAIVPLDRGEPSGDSGDARIERGIMMDETVERPEAGAMRSELRQILERRIDALPEQFRTVFVLRDVEELSVEETAECLDLPPATVRTRAFRARALLRESLTRELDAATVDAFGFAGERCDRIVAKVLQAVRLFNPS